MAHRTTATLAFVYFVWTMMLLDYHFFLGERVFGPLGKMGVFTYIPLIALIAAQAPALVGNARGYVWYPPLLALAAVGFIGSLMAINLAAARGALQLLLIYLVFSVGTLVFVRTPRQATPLLVMMVAQFVWWGVNSGMTGVVTWHPARANENDYAGLMVMGVGICYWFGVAASRRWERWASFALAGYCALGVVVTVARGAMLTLGVVALWIWLRSRNKLTVGAAIVIGGTVAVGVALLVLPDGLLVAELQSIFEEGNTEGTGGKRWSHWKAAMRVWMANPLFGTGAANFGIYASQFFKEFEVPFFENPLTMYEEQLHNTYVQILSEFGLLGALTFVWLLIDFQLKNRAIRTPGRALRWEQRGGGRFHLNDLARGLEVANIANLLSGMFYSSFLYSNFYIVWALNQLLWALTRPTGAERGAPFGRRVGWRRSAVVPPAPIAPIAPTPAGIPR